jgi:hypothetical protein
MIILATSIRLFPDDAHFDGSDPSLEMIWTRPWCIRGWKAICGSVRRRRVIGRRLVPQGIREGG